MRSTWQPGRRAFEAFSRAVETYNADILPWILYLEGKGRPSTADIAAVARRVRDRCGMPPLIFVDYLQLLAPASDRMTDKQAVDRHVTDLRQLARELKTSVVCISSLNRASYYSGSIGLDDMKESGSLEYGADTVLGLQVRGIKKIIAGASGKGKDSEKAISRAVEAHIDQDKRSERGKREIVVLKSRGYGMPPRHVPLDFCGPASLFYEPDGADD